MTVFASGGKARTFDYQAGDVGYVPFAMGHYVENTGDEPLRFLELFRSDRFADVSLSQWMALTPHELVRAHLNLDPATVAALRRTSRSSLRRRGRGRADQDPSARRRHDQHGDRAVVEHVPGGVVVEEVADGPALRPRDDDDVELARPGLLDRGVAGRAPAEHAAGVDVVADARDELVELLARDLVEELLLARPRVRRPPTGPAAAGRPAA